MLFNEVKNVKAEEIKKFISVNVSTNYGTIRPYIETAEREYILKLLGQEQYDELAEYYESHEASEERLDDLLNLVQKALINLAYYRGFPLLVIKMGDGGAYRNETETQKGLYKYQEKALYRMFKADGFNGLDSLLEYLLSPNSRNQLVFSSSKVDVTRQQMQVVNLRWNDSGFHLTVFT